MSGYRRTASGMQPGRTAVAIAASIFPASYIIAAWRTTYISAAVILRASLVLS